MNVSRFTESIRFYVLSILSTEQAPAARRQTRVEC